MYVNSHGQGHSSHTVNLVVVVVFLGRGGGGDLESILTKTRRQFSKTCALP